MFFHVAGVLNVWGKLITVNFVILKDVVVVPQSNFRRYNTGNFRRNITLLSSVEFHFLGSFIRFSRWLGLRGTFCGLKIVGTVPFANFAVSDRVFKMCFLSKCSEHICKFFTDSNSLSTPRQRFSNSFQASPCSENRKKFRSGLFSEWFLHTEMAQYLIFYLQSLWFVKFQAYSPQPRLDAIN